MCSSDLDDYPPAVGPIPESGCPLLNTMGGERLGPHMSKSPVEERDEAQLPDDSDGDADQIPPSGAKPVVGGETSGSSRSTIDHQTHGKGNPQTEDPEDGHRRRQQIRVGARMPGRREHDGLKRQGSDEAETPNCERATH